MTDSLHLPFQGLVYGHVVDCISAVNLEAAASGAKTAERFRVTGGKLLNSIGTLSLWSFAVETSFSLPIGSRGQLFLGADTTPVSVELVGHGDEDVVISTRELLPLINEDFDHSGYLDFTPSGVLGALCTRLEDELLNTDIEESLALELIAPDPGQWVYEELADVDQSNVHEVANSDQDRAAARAVEPGLRFTWGPPGTGKTKVLANAVSNAVIDGLRVLVLAHSNVAVDVAMLRIADVLDQEHDIVSSNQVIRVGAPRLAAMMERDAIIPERIALGRLPETAQQLDEISIRLREISSESRTASESYGLQLANEAAELRSTHRQLAAHIGEVEQELVKDAHVIGSTLAKAVIDDSLWQWAPDVIIVDEASMANLPYLLALALQNPSTLSCFGDFRQLPPIAIAQDEQARRWFGQDIFEFARVRELYERGEPDERTSILRVQFRMGESICESVNKLAYDGLLRTSPAARNAAILMSDAEPCPGAEIVLVNTAGSGAVCEVSRAADSYSRVNLYSAAVSSSLAQFLASQFDDHVGVLSPYSVQAQVMSQLSSGVPYVESATVHRFQGGERRGIVVDLVDDSPQTAPSVLSGNDSELSMRLMNVAASRAMGKLILVGNLDFIDTYHPMASGARRLIQAARDSGAEEIEVETWLRSLPMEIPAPSDSVRWLSNFASAVVHILQSHWDEPQYVESNLPIDALFGAEIEQLIQRSEQSNCKISIRGSASVLNAIKSDWVDRRLQIAGATPWVAIGSKVVIGSTNIDSPAAVCDSLYLRTILQRHFLASE